MQKKILLDEGSTELVNRGNKQQIIAVAGTEGAGKTTILTNLVALLAEKSVAKILILDFDTLNGNVGQFFNVSADNVFDYTLPDNKNSSINYLVDFIDKNTFDTGILSKAAIKYKRYENLSIVTGNNSIHVCKSVLNSGYYEKIIDKAKELYDFIFIDTSSNIFLDSTQFALSVSDKILFVTEPTKICVDRTQKIFEEVYTAWNIGKEKIELVLNKVTKGSIEKAVMREFFSEYKIISFINYDEKYVRQLNMGRPYVIDNEPLDYENMLEEFDFIKKKNFKERLMSGRVFDFSI
ncbi:MAG: AAA family ATPase [Clostridia bacterium]|nr:AAA family ATPase [Clostridia bacterium]